MGRRLKAIKDKFIVIGDIHGSLNELNQVLILCTKCPTHKYIFLGDYIDGGPESDSVISRIKHLHGIFLMGNHEISLIRMRNNFPGKVVPEHKSKIPKNSEANFNWITSNLQFIYQTSQYIFVHAGLDPNNSLENQKELDLLWSRYEGEYMEFAPRIVIHGHTGVDTIEHIGNRVNINTNAGYGGPVTALILPEWEIIASNPTPKNKGSMNIEAMKRELEELQKKYPRDI